jgi:hypothetical protein
MYLDIRKFVQLCQVKSRPIWKPSKEETTCDPDVDGMFCLLLGLLFYPEDEGSMFLRNVRKFYQSTRCYIP